MRWMSRLQPVTALLRLAKSALELRRYVLEGTMADIITDSELAAAKDAFRKVPMALDAKQQVWSAINHLEAAHERLKAVYFGRGAPFFYGDQHYFARLSQKDRYILCFMACCYNFPGEAALCEDALAAADAIEWRRCFGWTIWPTKGSFIYPRAAGEVIRSFFSPQENVLVDDFRTALAMPRPTSIASHDEGLGQWDFFELKKS